MSCIIGEHQTLLFSATMPRDIEALVASCLHDPIRVELNREVIAPPNITHCFQMVSPQEKLASLKKYLAAATLRQVIIFCNSRRNGEELFHKIRNTYPSIEYIHGGLDQSRRTSIFDSFKKLKTKILIATDVAGRGLDFTHVSHILNYNFPLNAEIYTHRTGRTGRMGRVGSAMTYVTARDLDALKRMLTQNRIEPVWQGEAPDLHHIPKSAGRKRSGMANRKFTSGRGRTSGKKPFSKPRG
jgi:ATP-dependent RNA helicase DeaD